MIVPVALRIDAKFDESEYSLDGLNTIRSMVDRTFSLQATVLDLETGESRTYAFKTVQATEPDDATMQMGTLEVDDQLRRLRVGLDRWLGDELGEPIDLERVKDFVRGASPKEIGAVMGVCLGVLDQRSEADIVTLLRALTAQVEQMVTELRRPGSPR